MSREVEEGQGRKMEVKVSRGRSRGVERGKGEWREVKVSRRRLREVEGRSRLVAGGQD